MNIEPIAILHSPLKEKFGIPRQANLIEHAVAELHFIEPYCLSDAFKGLEEFSHIWLQFGFHLHKDRDFRSSVRPPRLGGNATRGVFATRSPFRPNALGLSLVKLLNISYLKNKTIITIQCPDLIDQTPIYDIKPYIEYCDKPDNSRSGFASDKPTKSLNVVFTDEIETKLLKLLPKQTNRKEFLKLVEDLLSLDPRPAYKNQVEEDQKTYGIKLYDVDVRWHVKSGTAYVVDLTSTETT